MARLNEERVKSLQPIRMAYAKSRITDMGYQITYEDKTRLEFIYNGHIVKFYPYSGWASGKSIQDCRGIYNLLNQLQCSPK